MITNFETETEPLTDEEKKLIPILIRGFHAHKGKGEAIKAPAIISAINKDALNYGLKKSFSGARLRKICNYIRSEGILPLIATSSGYYISYDREEIEKQILSLNERADAIRRSADGMRKFLDTVQK